MKILGNGRFWGSGSMVAGDLHAKIVKLLRFSDLPMRTIAERFGVSTDSVSVINVFEKIRPKGFRPERVF